MLAKHERNSEWKTCKALYVFWDNDSARKAKIKQDNWATDFHIRVSHWSVAEADVKDFLYDQLSAAISALSSVPVTPTVIPLARLMSSIKVYNSRGSNSGHLVSLHHTWPLCWASRHSKWSTDFVKWPRRKSTYMHLFKLWCLLWDNTAVTTTVCWWNQNTVNTHYHITMVVTAK